MLQRIQEGLIQLREGDVNFYLLHDAAGVYLIDSGFMLGKRCIRRALERLERPLTDIRMILLTHGHLDHTANLHWLKEVAGAPVFAFASERPHVRGEFPYRGISRVCGFLEGIGRVLVRYRPVEIDEELFDGQVIDGAWGGLRVVHLPGHSDGHCGFFSERTGILFSGDLFVNRGLWTRLPPPIFNSCPRHFPESIRKVLALAPRGILANHCDRASPEKQLARFREKFDGGRA